MFKRMTLTGLLLLAIDARAQQQHETMMVVEMRTGDTHTTPSATKAETKLARWFELETASVSNRYQFIDNARGATTANHEQYQVSFKGRFKFDSAGRFSLHAGVFSGNSFFGGWNNSGWGTGQGRSNLYLKQLYLSAQPARGVELQYGSLYLRDGEATEITAYDYDGYLTGERVSVTRPDKLYFDEVTVTAGYLGDLNAPGVNKRYHRLRQSNFHQVLLAKRVGERARVSAEYSSESGVDVFRQAMKLKLPELRVVDSLLFEQYERAGRQAGYGFNIYGEKKLHQRFTLGGGYAQLDRTRFNSDRFPQGKRLHVSSVVALTPEFSFVMTATHGVGTLAANLPRTRLDIGFNYNLLHRLRRAGLF